MPKISIVIPVYNVEQYLRQCLDSVINQTAKDIEVICVNDCSTDDSLSILKSYAQKDNRIVIIDKNSNEGLGITRNVGQKAAHGEYILFLDSDDYIAPNLCEKLFSKIELCKADVIYYNSASFEERNPLKFKNRYRIANMNRKISSDEVVCAKDYYELVTKLTCPVWFKCYRRDFLIQNDIYSSEYRCMEDSLFNVSLLLANPKITYIDEILHYYRIRQNSLNKNIESKLDLIFMVHKECIDKILESDLCLKDKLIFIKSRIKWLQYWTGCEVCSNKSVLLENQKNRKEYYKDILSLFSLIDLQDARLPESFWKDLFILQKYGMSVWQDYSKGFLRYRFKFGIFKFTIRA